MRHNLLVITMIGLTGGAFAAAGPLTPPAGPPSPTGRTLLEVEPRIPVNAETAPPDQFGFDAQFTIIEPGSYFLTGDIDGVDGKSSIVIVADNVTLDLNGFTVRGPRGAGVQPGQAAVLVVADLVAIRNGIVGDSGGAGIDADGANIVLEDLSVFSCDGFGIAVNGPGATVRRAEVTECGAGGVSVQHEGGLIADCVVTESAGVGIFAIGARIDRCRVADIREGVGYMVGTSEIVASMAQDIEFQSMRIGSRSVVRDCLIENAGSVGVELEGEGSHIVGNAIHDAEIGVLTTASGNRIESNRVQHQFGLVWTVGIRTNGAGGGNIVINNSVRGAATAYDLDPADAAGPIIGPADVATTTSPFANIAH